MAIKCTTLILALGVLLDAVTQAEAGDLPAGYSELQCNELYVWDGDTVVCDGQHLRMLGDGEPDVEGIDAPEVDRAACPAERHLGLVATARTIELISLQGLVIEDSGVRDITKRKRPLVKLRLQDGRTIGSILLSEELAEVWKPRKRGRDWCGK